MSGDELAFSSRYKLDVKLGSGGMGTVYRAYDCVLKKNVAVKLLLPSRSQNMAVRFQQEAKTSAKLDHPNIIRVLDFGQNDKGEFYLIMEYLNGKTLDEIVNSSGPLDVNSALSIFKQICLGMEHARSHGVLHRDVKPSNIMISDKTNHVTIVDFGVAKLLSDDLQLTGKGAPVGSPIYMSPEQALGKELDARSDIYSMGCLMYMTLRGKPPILGANSLETLRQKLEDEVPLLNDDFDTPEFSEELEALVQTALEKDPDNRFQNFEELHQALTAVNRTKAAPIDTRPIETVAVASKRDGSTSFRKLAIITFGVLATFLSIFVYKILTENRIETKPKKLPAEVDEAKKDFEITHYPAYLFLSPRWLVASGKLHKKGIEGLVKFKRWGRLIIDDPNIDDTDLRFVETLPLMALDLSKTKITNEGLKSLTLPKLKCLILNDNPQITDKSVPSIKTFEGLEILALRGTGVTDKGVEELAKIKSLRSIDLEQLTGVTPRSLKVLEELPNLRCLKISGTAIGVNDIDELLKFPSLRYISFANEHATDATFDKLLKLYPLAINISYSQITDSSLKKLLDIDHRVFIDVRHCPQISEGMVAKVNKQFRVTQELINRVQSDFYDPSFGMGTRAQETSPRVLEDSFWYEPKIFERYLAPGYPESTDEFEDIKNSFLTKPKQQTVNPLRRDSAIDIEEEVKDVFERRSKEYLHTAK